MNPIFTPGANPRPASAKPDFEGLLVAIGKKRDRDAFIQIFNHFAPRLKSFLMKNGTPPARAEELMQDTMLRVWTHAASYNPAKANASTWIFTIARNKRIDSLRRKKYISVDMDKISNIPDEHAVHPAQHMTEADRSEKIAAAMLGLPHEQAYLIRKSFFEDKTHKQIAAETKLPLGTIKSRIRLAMDKLRPQLQKEGYDDL